MRRVGKIVIALLSWGGLAFSWPIPARGAGGEGPGGDRGLEAPVLGGECRLRGAARMDPDTQIYASRGDQTLIGRFTGESTPLVLAGASASAGERVRIQTGTGRGSFRLDGFLEAGQLPLVAAGRIALVEGHLWIARGESLDLVRYEGGRFEVQLALAAALDQTFRGWAGCSQLAIAPPVSRGDWAPPTGARGYVLKRANLALFDSWRASRERVTVLERAADAGGLLVFGTDRQAEWVRVHYNRGVVVDAWARESDLEALPPGETLDQAPSRAASDRRRLAAADGSRVVRARRELPIRLVAKASATVIGYIERDAQASVVQTVAGWASVLPQPLTVAPPEGAGFWVPVAALKQE